MAIFRTRVTIPISGVNANILAGSKFEFLARPSAITLFASQDGAAATCFLDFTLGNVVVGEDLAPNFTATAGLIQRQNDGMGAGVGMGGDRIQLRARNTSAAAVVNVAVMLDINEL